MSTHWWRSLSPREKAALYEEHLLSDVPWEALTKEQQAKCEAMVELMLLKYEAEDRGKIFRVN